MKYVLYLLAICLVSLSFQSIERQLKRIRYQGHDLEFYVIPNKSISPRKDRVYYWFSHGAVNHTIGDYQGALLDGEFAKYTSTYKLVEKGKFNYGLKEGVWKYWDSSGSLKEIIKFHNGRRQGFYVKYDSLGNVEQNGRYSKDRKHKRWIDYKNQDTVFYNKGELLTPRFIDTSKTSFFKKLKTFFKKEKASSLENKKSRK